MTGTPAPSVPTATDDARWQAVCERRSLPSDKTNWSDSSVYAVCTTGIYCRPGCASPLPRRENVRFHLSCEDAEGAGFRACKRCRPDRILNGAPP